MLVDELFDEQKAIAGCAESTDFTVVPVPVTLLVPVMPIASVVPVRCQRSDLPRFCLRYQPKV